jgi:macrolide-specific efflux system membrane fusion protein
VITIGTKGKRWLGLALLVAAATGGGYYWWAGREEAPSYRAATVTRGDLEVRVVSTGVVQPRNRLEIKPPIPGRVEEVLVREGQNVDKGALLAWMSSSERAALLDAARARGPEEVRRWEELYRPTAILAPIRGTVIARNMEPGQTFTGNDAVFVMSDRLIVKAQVDETDIAQVRPRQAARVTLDAYPEHDFGGKVEAIAYDAKTVNNVTTYEVDVLPLDPPAFLRSGMTANVSFAIETRHGVLRVPSQALRSRDGRAYVLVPAPAGAAPAEREVQTGVTDGHDTEVVAGLAEGEAVLIPALRTATRNERGSPLSPMPRRR